MIQVIKSEIERRIKIQDDWAGRKVLPGRDLAFAVKEELKQLLSFLSDLEKECEKPFSQDEDFRGEMREWVELMVAASFPEQDNDFISEEDYRSVIKQTARHFAQWGAEHLKK